MTSNNDGVKQAWDDFTMPTSDEADIANWNEIVFTFDSTDRLQALYD